MLHVSLEITLFLVFHALSYFRPCAIFSACFRSTVSVPLAGHHLGLQ